MQPSYTPHLIQQASRVAEMLDAGLTHRQIGERLGVSAVRVTQIRQRLPELEAYLGQPGPLDRLRSHREQLWTLRRQVLDLAGTIRRDLRELDEELDSARVDTLLGLRGAVR
jgi:hypothetical protein